MSGEAYPPAGWPRDVGAGTYREGDSGPRTEDQWYDYCEAGAAELRKQHRALGKALQELDRRRGTIDEALYHGARDALISQADLIQARWNALAAECGGQRVDIDGIGGSEPPGRMPPRNDTEAAADEAARAKAEQELRRLEELFRLNRVDPPIESDPLGNFLIDLLGGVVIAPIRAAGSAIASTFADDAVRAVAGVSDDAARGALSVADDATGAISVADDATGAVSVADDAASAADELAGGGSGGGPPGGGTPGGGGGAGGPGGGGPPSTAGSRNIVGGQQYTVDCVGCSELYAGANGLPVSTLAPPGSPGIFSPLPMHYAVRNVDGTITDASILWNIRTHSGGVHLDPAVRAFEQFDTFTPDTYAWLIEQLRLARLNNPG